jgi:hypothetical protein
MTHGARRRWGGWGEGFREARGTGVSYRAETEPIVAGFPVF